MTWRYAVLSLLIVAIVTVRLILEELRTWYHSPPPLLSISSFDDPESQLATGQRIPLACADMWALELISGVSDTLASELLARRPVILQTAQQATPEIALQHAHGVGIAKGRELSKYLSMDPGCSESEPFEIFSPID